MTPSGPQVPDQPRPCRRGRAATRRSSPREPPFTGRHGDSCCAGIQMAGSSSRRPNPKRAARQAAKEAARARPSTAAQAALAAAREETAARASRDRSRRRRQKADEDWARRRQRAKRRHRGR